MSPATSFCSAEEMMQVYDWRVLADLLSTTGQRLERDALLPLLQDRLEEATGLVYGACRRGGVYGPTSTPASLQGLARVMLRRMTADLAFWLLFSGKRPADAPPLTCQTALSWLEALSQGVLLFGKTV